MFDKIERAMKRNIQHLQELNNSLGDILSRNIFAKTMGLLVNTSVSEWIGLTMKLRHIKVEEQRQLHHILSMLMSLSQLFTMFHTNKSPLKVDMHVPSWLKLRHLLDILVSEDMW